MTRASRESTPRKVPVRHAERAAEARDQPGEWVLVDAYGTPEIARTIERSILRPIRLHIRAYNPIGDFEAKCVRAGERGTEVWVRYVGEPAAAETGGDA